MPGLASGGEAREIGLVGLERNLFTLLDRAAHGPWRDRLAFAYEGTTCTYAELHGRALRLANGLLEFGVRPGDRVAVMLSNRLEWPETLFGLAAMGAVCVPVNILLRPDEVVYLCQDSNSTVLIADHTGELTLSDTSRLPDLVIRVGSQAPAGTHAYEEVLADPDPVAGPSLHDEAMLYYSSGTTGLPKAAVHTHDGILWNAIHQIPDLRLSPDDHYLVVPSLSWAAGFNDLVLPLMYIGGRSTLMPSGGVTPKKLADTCQASGATHAMLVPTLLKQLLAAPDELDRIRQSELRWIVSGAEPVPLPVIKALQEELPDCQVVQGYGMSEFPTIITILQPEDSVSHVGSAGQPVSIAQLAIQLEDGSIVDSGEGEILLRSPATSKGYHNRPEETARAFADGWFHTGDLGRLDPEGYVQITGRKKDMIISGGLNVYPREAEEIIYGIPQVVEAAVVGVPDDKWGEVAVAVIVPGPDGIDPEAVIDACRAQLASYKCPRSVLLRDEPMPRNLSGKLLKRELRPWAEQKLSETVGRGTSEVISS
jgi:acyl-CoA synthetase (AMP-forming)/AMP-acid ligase II